MGSQASSQTRGEGKTVAGVGRLGGASAPSAEPSLRLRVPARADQIAVVRAVLEALAESVRLTSRVLIDMRLAVTEACTNVVRHAYDHDGGTLEVLVRVHAEHVEVVVSDQGRGIGAGPPSEGPGLGLSMIAALADRLDVQHAPGAGSRLAMTFPLPPAGLAPVEAG